MGRDDFRWAEENRERLRRREPSGDSSGFDDKFAEEAVLHDGALCLAGFLQVVGAGEFDREAVGVHEVGNPTEGDPQVGGVEHAHEPVADVLRAGDAVVREPGVGAVLDHRLDDYLQFDADVAGTGCRVVGIGENSPDPGFTNDGAARSKDVSYQFMSMFNTPDLRVGLRGVAHLMETDRLSIELARTYDLTEAGEAQRAVVEDSFFGKLVIEP